MKNRFRLPDRLILSAILIGGGCLRLIGLPIGLPDSPDPREVLIAADILNLVHFTAPPQIYNWPGTAWFYGVAALGKLVSLTGHPLSEADVIFLARALNVGLSTLTLWLTYRIGVDAAGMRTGQIAAGLLAVAMLHATNESRFALVDIPATFCVTLFLWYLVRGGGAFHVGERLSKEERGWKPRLQDPAKEGKKKERGWKPRLQENPAKEGKGIALAKKRGWKPRLQAGILAQLGRLIREDASCPPDKGGRGVFPNADPSYPPDKGGRGVFPNADASCPPDKGGRGVLWLGVILGIGVAVKFTAAFAVFSLLIFIRQPGFWKKIALLTATAAVTFTLICPYWLVDLVSPTWNRFFEDFWYEATHYHQGHFGLISHAESGWGARFLYLWVLLKWGMGLPLTCLVAVGVLCALVSLKSGRGLEALLLAFILPSLLCIGVHKVKFARHLLILYPGLVLLAALAVTRLPEIAASLFPTRLNIKKGVAVAVRAVAGLVWLYGFVYTFAFASVLLNPPTKQAAADWIATHIPAESAIATAPEPLFPWLLPEVELAVADTEAEWVLILVPDLEVFQKYQAAPEAYQETDWYPLGDLEVAETLEFYKGILGAGSRYEHHKTFRAAPAFFGLRISETGAPFPMRALVHPELRLYRRRE